MIDEMARQLRQLLWPALHALLLFVTRGNVKTFVYSWKIHSGGFSVISLLFDTQWILRNFETRFDFCRLWYLISHPDSGDLNAVEGLLEECQSVRWTWASSWHTLDDQNPFCLGVCFLFIDSGKFPWCTFIAKVFLWLVFHFLWVFFHFLFPASGRPSYDFNKQAPKMSELDTSEITINDKIFPEPLL